MQDYFNFSSETKLKSLVINFHINKLNSYTNTDTKNLRKEYRMIYDDTHFFIRFSRNIFN